MGCNGSKDDEDGEEFSSFEAATKRRRRHDKKTKKKRKSEFDESVNDKGGGGKRGKKRKDSRKGPKDAETLSQPGDDAPDDGLQAPMMDGLNGGNTHHQPSPGVMLTDGLSGAQTGPRSNFVHQSPNGASTNGRPGAMSNGMAEVSADGLGSAPSSAFTTVHQPQNPGAAVGGSAFQRPPPGQQKMPAPPPQPQPPYLEQCNSVSTDRASSAHSITESMDFGMWTTNPEYAQMQPPEYGEVDSLELLLGFSAPERLQEWAVMPPFPPSTSKRSRQIIDWSEEVGLDPKPVQALYKTEQTTQALNAKMLKMNEKMLKTVEARSQKRAAKKRQQMRINSNPLAANSNGGDGFDDDNVRRGSMASVHSVHSSLADDASDDLMSDLAELEEGRVAMERHQMDLESNNGSASDASTSFNDGKPMGSPGGGMQYHHPQQQQQLHRQSPPRAGVGIPGRGPPQQSMPLNLGGGGMVGMHGAGGGGGNGHPMGRQPAGSPGRGRARHPGMQHPSQPMQLDGLA